MRKMVASDAAPIREAVGMFNNVDALYDCIDDLQTHGFDRSDITLLDHPHLTEGLARNSPLDTHEAEDNPAAVRGAFIDPQSLGDAEGALIGLPLYVFTLVGAGIAASFGLSTTVIVTIAAVAGLTGALLGGGAALWLKRRHDSYYKDQVEHGGIPLWVHTKDPAHEKQAMESLKSCNAEDIHMHDMAEMPYEVREGRVTAYHIIHKEKPTPSL